MLGRVIFGTKDQQSLACEAGGVQQSFRDGDFGPKTSVHSRRFIDRVERAENVVDCFFLVVKKLERVLEGDIGYRRNFKAL